MTLRYAMKLEISRCLYVNLQKHVNNPQSFEMYHLFTNNTLFTIMSYQKAEMIIH